MSLRIKLALSLSIAVAVFLGVDHFLRAYRFQGTSEALEVVRGQTQVERVNEALAGVEADLDLALANAALDPTRFIRDLDSGSTAVSYTHLTLPTKA